MQFELGDRMADVFDFQWTTDFKEGQLVELQQIDSGELDAFVCCKAVARNPECSLWDEKLTRGHCAVLEAITEYARVSATERVPNDPTERSFLLSTKSLGREGHLVDHDKKHQAQVDKILDAVNQVWSAWCDHARLVKLFEVVNQLRGSV
jgi:hypothetical protein